MELDEFIELTGANPDWLKDYKGKEALRFVTPGLIDLDHVHQQTDTICMAAVKRDPRQIRHVKEKTIDICMEAVKQDGLLIRFCKRVWDPQGKLAMAAVKQNGNAISLVRHISIDLVMAAVKQDGFAICAIDIDCIRYVDVRDDIEMAAVKQNGYVISVVREQTPELCMAAVKEDGCAISDIKVHTPELCIEAMKSTKDSAIYIDITAFGNECSTAALIEKLTNENKALKAKIETIYNENEHQTK